MRFSGIIGVLLVLAVVIGNLSLADDVLSFIYLPALLFCFFGTIGLSYLSYGALDTLKGLASLRLLIATGAGDHLQRSAEVLRGNITHLYACGIVGSMISFLKIISYAASKNTFIWGLSPTMISFLPLFYALLGSEFLLRPAARRLEGIIQGHGMEY